MLQRLFGSSRHRRRVHVAFVFHCAIGVDGDATAEGGEGVTQLLFTAFDRLSAPAPYRERTPVLSFHRMQMAVIARDGAMSFIRCFNWVFRE